MFDESQMQKKPKKVRMAREEYLNRSGHWERDFSARSEPWPIIEHWAAESGYYMVGMRGPKRLYQKGDSESRYVTLVEVKQNDRRVTLSAWVHVGWLARAMNLFMVPKEMGIEPFGFWGIVPRRAACRDLNNLLLRMNQPLILASQGFHLLDWHPSVLSLLALWLAAWGTFVGVGLSRLEVKVGLTNPLLQALGQTSGLLFLFFVLLFIAFQFAEKKYLHHTGAKYGAAAGVGVVQVITALVLGSFTRAEMTREKFAYHCLSHADSRACSQVVHVLSPKERAALAQRLEALQSELAVKP